jgi:hypothetical protein
MAFLNAILCACGLCQHHGCGRAQGQAEYCAQSFHHASFVRLVGCDQWRDDQRSDQDVAAERSRHARLPSCQASDHQRRRCRGCPSRPGWCIPLRYSRNSASRPPHDEAAQPRRRAVRGWRCQDSVPARSNRPDRLRRRRRTRVDVGSPSSPAARRQEDPPDGQQCRSLASPVS